MPVFVICRANKTAETYPDVDKVQHSRLQITAWWAVWSSKDWSYLPWHSTV